MRRFVRNAPLLGLIAAAGAAGVLFTAVILRGSHADEAAVVHVREVVRSQAEGRTDDTFRWSGRVADGGTVEVRGVNGPIHFEPADGPQVEVEAEKRGRRSDPAEVRIEVVEHEHGVTICAVYPTPRGRSENRCDPDREWSVHTKNNDVRVAFRVRVPEGLKIVGRTINGELEAEDLRNDIALYTVNGDIDVSTTGWAEARTVNGSIEAALGAVPPDGLSFETVNGDLHLDLPDDADAEIDARWLNGSIETDLEMALEGRVSRRRIHGRLGEGGPLLRLKTVNGSIHIR
ncbi:MAG: hypothetical protein D6701_01795 [Gemmatimonadetes bacterium]|nr:MAG: hypothetical protein D6701_01795 [Gemmatimonadota bacterium]